MTSGAPPTGTSIDPDTGVLFGLPNTTGYFTFVVTATNSAGATDTPQPITIMVSAATLNWVTYTPTSLEVVEGNQIVPYTYSVSRVTGACRCCSLCSNSAATSHYR